MSLLKWDATEFLECFEVEPEVEDHGVSHTYKVNRGGLDLMVTLWEIECFVQTSLYREGSDRAISTLAFSVRGSAQYVNDKRGSHIRFSDCVIGPSRFWYLEAGDLSDKSLHPHGVDVLVGVDPDILVLVTAP